DNWTEVDVVSDTDSVVFYEQAKDGSLYVKLVNGYNFYVSRDDGATWQLAAYTPSLPNDFAVTETTMYRTAYFLTEDSALESYDPDEEAWEPIAFIGALTGFDYRNNLYAGQLCYQASTDRWIDLETKVDLDQHVNFRPAHVTSTGAAIF